MTENHIIIQLVKEAKKRHGGNKVQIYPAIHNDWHQSHGFAAGYHTLEYKLDRNEKTSHCIAMNVYGKFIVEEGK